MRIFVLALLTLTLALPVFAGDGRLEINQTCAVNTGCFSGDTAGFPVTIDGSAGSSYVLTGDLQVPDANTTGISMSASDMTVDLGGFQIRGVTTCSGTPLVCSPTGVGSGISDGGSAHGVRVHNGTVVGMGSSGVRLSGDHSIVEDVRVTQNGSNGIATVFAFAFGAVVQDCHADRNGGSGISFNSKDGIVTGSTATQNGNFGISASGLIQGNLARENERHGIQGSGTIIDNSSSLNGDPASPSINSNGIMCSNCSVRGNTVVDNYGYGLRVSNGGAYRENVMVDNALGGVFEFGTSNNSGDNYCVGPGVVSATCP